MRRRCSTSAESQLGVDPYREVGTPHRPYQYSSTMSLACLGLALGAQSGLERDRSRLQHIVETRESNQICHQLQAELLQGEERLETLRELRRAPMTVGRSAELLWDGPLDELRLRGEAQRLSTVDLISARGWGRVFYNALDAATLEALETADSSSPSQLKARRELRWRAHAFALLTGEPGAAREHAEGAIALSAAPATWERERLALALIATDDEAGAQRALEGVSSPTSAQALLALARRGDSEPLSRLIAARSLRLVKHDDGEALLKALQNPEELGQLRRSLWPHWLRRVTKGKRELSASLRWGVSRWRDTEGRLELSLFNAAWDLQAAEALGDEAWADEVRPIRDRLREAVLDRERALELIAVGAL